MRFISPLIVFILSAMLVSCANPSKKYPGKTEGERLNAFFEATFQEGIERSPMAMTYLGIPKRQDELDDFSEAFAKESHELQKKYLKVLHSFDYDQLSPQDQLSYTLFEKQLEDGIEGWKWKDYHYPVNQMHGIHSGLPSMMMNMHRIANKKDAENYISRLNQYQRLFGQVITKMMRAEAAGVVPPKFVYPKVLQDSKNLITGRPFTKTQTDSPLLSDFKRKVGELKITKNEKTHLTKEAEKALKTSVGPAYQELIAFLQKQEKRATTDDGAWKFPKGDEFYQYRLRMMTTTNYSPEKIHQMGLDNVKRIHDEMRAIQKKVGFKGSLQDFFKHMQTSKKFFFSDNKKGRQAYLKLATNLINTMRTRLDKLFITKPKAAIEVKAVEPYREKSAGMAFYNGPSEDGKRPGTYYVNLSNIKALPKWEAEALAYHEGIPGHHMQISIAKEMEALPSFRRHGHFTAYTEGWGLYSERVPKEIGFYKDPYSDFGRLSMELVRACRLVVDSGIHHKKWTREQAIAYLDKNTPGDHDDNVRQINRYVVTPGQATAYMVGMLKIVELKKMAQNELGQKFDIRKFHDRILTSGAVPLDVLEELIKNYIREEKQNSKTVALEA
ncbi:MAG: DUF885 domain-containing protein [Bdellovibrionales bacterium]|nr:DUF885 domain-containing protein [Bdellovibrionales bacterium]